jgi:hypothetical protein
MLLGAGGISFGAENLATAACAARATGAALAAEGGVAATRIAGALGAAAATATVAVETPSGKESGCSIVSGLPSLLTIVSAATKDV